MPLLKHTSVSHVSGGDGAPDGDRVHSGAGATDQSLPSHPCLTTPLPHSLPLLQRDEEVSEEEWSFSACGFNRKQGTVPVALEWKPC